MTKNTQRPDPARDDAHALMPPWLAALIPPFYSQDNMADPTVYAKLFTPDSSWTWYVTEYDPKVRECFGLVDGLEIELGYFGLDELEQVRGKLGLQVERDIWFQRCPLSMARTR